MSDRIYTLDEIKTVIAPIAKSYGLEAMYLFGSYARGEAKTDSDLDFRISKGKLRGLWQFYALMDELETGFQKQIDIVTDSDAVFLQHIRKDEVLVYDAGND